MKNLALLILLPFLCHAKATDQLFEKYKNRYFVETGTHEGDGIQKALQASFDEIHSIELGQQDYQTCKQLFSQNSNVHIWFGDSGKLLSKVISEIKEPITFWLDAHWSGGGSTRSDTNTPILKELDAIKNHPIKTHTILIDDVRIFGSEEFDHITVSDIIKILYEINSDYVISYEDGYTANDILVAKIRN